MSIEADVLENLRRHREWVRAEHVRPTGLDEVTAYVYELMNETRELDPLEISLAKHLEAFYRKTISDREKAGEAEAKRKKGKGK